MARLPQVKRFTITAVVRRTDADPPSVQVWRIFSDADCFEKAKTKLSIGVTTFTPLPGSWTGGWRCGFCSALVVAPPFGDGVLAVIHENT